MNLKTITIKEYLAEKSIQFKESGTELITACVFADCDKDSRNGEAHLYFNSNTGQYDCKKCGAKGNLLTLAKHFGDIPRKSTKSAIFNPELVENCHQALPANIRQYLNARGITDATIEAYKLGYGQFYRKWWITVPIKDAYGNFAYFKLRQDPTFGDDKITYPKGTEAQLYDWQMLTNANIENLVICEGGLDRLALISKGVSAITSTHGAGTFKEDWIKNIGKYRKIYICFDNDEAGKKGAERVAKMVEKGGFETYITLDYETPIS